MNKLRIPEGEFTFAQLAEANPVMGSLTLLVLFSREIAEGGIIQTQGPTHQSPARYKIAGEQESAPYG